MHTTNFVVKVVISAFTLGASLYLIWQFGRPLLMSKEQFEKYLVKKSRFTRKIFRSYKPNAILNRITYFVGFMLGIVLFLFLVFALIVLWAG